MLPNLDHDRRAIAGQRVSLDHLRRQLAAPYDGPCIKSRGYDEVLRKCVKTSSEISWQIWRFPGHQVPLISAPFLPHDEARLTPPVLTALKDTKHPFWKTSRGRLAAEIDNIMALPTVLQTNKKLARQIRRQI